MRQIRITDGTSSFASKLVDCLLENELAARAENWNTLPSAEGSSLVAPGNSCIAIRIRVFRSNRIIRV